jgi:hypothetical protein
MNMTKLIRFRLPTMSAGFNWENFFKFRPGARVFRSDTKQQAIILYTLPFSDQPLRVQLDNGKIEDWYWYGGGFDVCLVTRFSEDGIGL